MQHITGDGTVTPVKPQFHATITASMRTMVTAFGPPALAASSTWILRVDQPGRRYAKQVILTPDLAASGFDPRDRTARPAVWQLISDVTDPDIEGGSFAPVILAVRAAVPPGELATLPPSSGFNGVPADTLPGNPAEGSR